jgi:hypothetical protein
MICRAWLVILATLAIGLPQCAYAQGRGGTGGTSPQLDLSISPASITFASADPDLNPSIAAAPVIISVRVRQNLGTWTLTVLRAAI